MRIERHFREEQVGKAKGHRADSSRALRSDSSAPQSSSPASEPSVDWDEDEYQCLRKEATQASEDGMVPLILSADDPAGVGALAKACKQWAGKQVIEHLPLVNGLCTSVDSRRLKKFLTSLPSGSNVFVDRPISLTRKDVPNHIFMDSSTQNISPTETSGSRLPGLSKVWDQGYKGKGQTIAVIDSGLYPHADLKGQVGVWVDFNENKPKSIDPFGHGTHVEGIIAGNGAKSGGKIMGVAPESELAALRIGSVGDAIKALQWCVDNKARYNISVVNLSLGDKATKPWNQDPWTLAAQKAIDSGLVVVVAAGNNGPISTPGTLPDAITVGAVDDKGTPDPADDTLAPFSGRGPTLDGIQKPDILAPGVGIFSTLSPDSAIDQADLPHMKKDYIALSGTSQAAPMVAGLAALIKEARPDLTPNQVRDVLLKSAHHYSGIADKDQGAGLVQADRALELALALPRVA